jgi:hypothetical protein
MQRFHPGRRGFVDGEPFGDYGRSDFNQFLHLLL